MELRLPHMLHLFNVFHENKDSDNCAKVLEEECIKMFGTKSLDDEQDCNVISMNSLNIHDANDMQKVSGSAARAPPDTAGRGRHGQTSFTLTPR